MLFALSLTLPFVQTKLGNYATKTLNEAYKININVEQVSVTVFGSVKLKKVLIKDHHKDTLIYANRIKTNILDWNKLIEGDLIFGDIGLNDLVFNMKTYKNEKQTNLDYFVAAFGESKTPPKKHFLLTATDVAIQNGQYNFIDENKSNPKLLEFKKLNIKANSLKIYGPEVSLTIKSMSGVDFHGIEIEDLKSKFSYTKKQIKLEDLDLKTTKSKIKGNLALNYEIEDFQNFTNKVIFDFDIKKASMASDEVRLFYKDLGKNNYFKIRGKIKGSLNNLVFSNLKLTDSRNTQIAGTIYFKNLLQNNGKEFYMRGKFEKIATNYYDLASILPTILGKNLPPILKKLGTINYRGNAIVTQNDLKTNFLMTTSIGNIKSNIIINNFNSSKKATYFGQIVLDKFNLGQFLDRKNIGKSSLDLAVNGKGFTKKSLNTSLKGSINSLYFNNYRYSNLELNANFKSGFYKGIFIANDPNLKLNFDGLVDMTTSKNKYNFKINVENADLKKLHFIKDSISKFNGNLNVNLEGNSIDNLSGEVYLNNAIYQNKKNSYNFDDFFINANFDENNVRTINLKSTDIIEGQIVGKFKFAQLQKLVTNSLGSLYSNFKPEKVQKGQFLKFNFSIYNKIIEIINPDIELASNTIISGNINSDDNEFKLNFNSPKVKAATTTFDNIRLKVDNKNPLYNAFVELDSIKTKQYKIRDFSLINVTMKDSLFFRTEFKGGSKGKDYFNLNLFHTINNDNNNVIGIRKSEVKVKDYLWFLNESESQSNQIIFDKKFKNFNFNNISLTHENQEICFFGDIKGADYKDLHLNLTNVDLNQITPTDPNFVFNGNLDANISYKQKNAVYEIPASVQIDNLNINKIDLGNLNFDIIGDENLKKFSVNSTLKNKNEETLVLNGKIEIIDDNTFLNVDLNLNRFNLGILGPIGGTVISNIRGFASGNASINGNLKKPDINGRLFVDEAGLKIPYLNVDYTLNERTIVDLTKDKFLFKNDIITDSKFGTNGFLNGSIEHNNFSDWKLDLAVNSNRLLVLDTKDSEETAYYGLAFIDGKATIKGPTNALVIKVEAKSEKGSSLKIPINNSEDISENSFIHFLTAKEKFNLKKGIEKTTNNYKGLELEFDLDITPEAEVEVILDRNTGHGMKGKGTGKLLFKINTLGKFNMWGDFVAIEGAYNFNFGGLIDKKFLVKKGGSISWEGDPMKARLNLEAIYKTTANPAVLLESNTNNRKIDVNVVIGLRGDLTKPEPDFNFEFPTVGNVMKSELDFKLTDKEIRQTQALYLLSTGGFLSAEGMNQSDLNQSGLDIASNLLSNIIKSNSEKFQFNVDIIGADRTTGRETDGLFVASVSSKINDRITINGKFGVPFGGVTQTAFVGNLEILYRVNQDGTVNLRAFNRENDITYIGEGIGYTQGLGISYEVDFNTFKELIQKITKSKKSEKATKKPQIDTDSEINPEQNKSSEPNNSDEVKPNSEGKIPDEY